MIITIDGPTASGKSTIAELLAKKLGFYYVNTGFLYRAITYILMERKKYTYEMLARPIKKDLEEIIDTKRLIYSYDDGPHVTFDNVDLTEHLKDASIDKGASIVSGVATVREMLLDLQRDIAKEHNIIAEGRDTGTVVFPHADYKFYLTAELSVRAQRWQELQQSLGTTLTLDEAKRMIKERDERDSKRTIAPLTVSQGAVSIDNSNMSEKETLEEFLKIIHI